MPSQQPSLRVRYGDLRFSLLSALRHLPASLRRLRSSRSHRRYAVGRLFAVVAAGLVVLHVQDMKSAADESRANWSAETVAVVATSVISPGETLDGSNTTVEARPADHVPPSAVRDLPEEALVASNTIEPGEVVLSGRTTDVGAGVAPGRRAITVDATTAMPTLAAGQHVDVLGNTGDSPPPDDGGEPLPPVTQVATDAIVLVVGNEEDPGEPTATLSVRSADVLALGRATINGPVVLVVRSG